MAKKNYYAVKDGYKKGIFNSWEECRKLVTGYPNAQYKGFSTLEEAENYSYFAACCFRKTATN